MEKRKECNGEAQENNTMTSANATEECHCRGRGGGGGGGGEETKKEKKIVRGRGGGGGEGSRAQKNCKIPAHISKSVHVTLDWFLSLPRPIRNLQSLDFNSRNRYFGFVFVTTCSLIREKSFGYN